MTTVPQPKTPTSSYTATYDAWNRLVKIVDVTNTVAEYEYDGLNRRIIKTIYSGGTLDHKQRFYYNQQYQTLEVRRESGGTEDSDPLDQYVWHPYYIDALLLRDYDADIDGTSIRYYYTHDANFNVTCIVSDSGSAFERFHYAPYGDLTVLDADFSDDADNSSDVSNSVTYTGRRHDSETGLYYYRNRFYHSLLGQFTSRDPIAYRSGDNNLYRYVESNPTNYFDFDGKERRPKGPSVRPGDTDWNCVGECVAARLLGTGNYCVTACSICAASGLNPLLCVECIACGAIYGECVTGCTEWWCLRRSVIAKRALRLPLTNETQWEWNIKCGYKEKTCTYSVASMGDWECDGYTAGQNLTQTYTWGYGVNAPPPPVLGCPAFQEFPGVTCRRYAYRWERCDYR